MARCRQLRDRRVASVDSCGRAGSALARRQLAGPITEGTVAHPAIRGASTTFLNEVSISSAQERWRRFNGHELVAHVLDGVKFKDGIKVTDDENQDNDTTDERVAA